MFRVLPEAFRSFLTTTRLSGVDLLVAQRSAARSTGSPGLGQGGISSSGSGSGEGSGESRGGTEKGYAGRASFLRTGGSFIASGGLGGGGGLGGLSASISNIGIPSSSSSSSSGPMQVS